MPDQPFSVDRPLPEGVRDLLFADAATCAAWRPASRHLDRVGLPRDHPAHVRVRGHVGDQRRQALDAEMYRFFDRHGRTLALRPDLTIPTARVVAHPAVRPAHAAARGYAGSVFRYEPPRAGRQHEFTQAGVELIGAARQRGRRRSDRAGGRRTARGRPARFSHHGRAHRLLPRPAAGAGLPERLAARLRSAVDRKSEAELEALLRETRDLPPMVRERCSRCRG